MVSEIPYEINCPNCGYDLRGDVSGRCPECGGTHPPESLGAFAGEFMRPAQHRFGSLSWVGRFFAVPVMILRLASPSSAGAKSYTAVARVGQYVFPVTLAWHIVIVLVYFFVGSGLGILLGTLPAASIASSAHFVSGLVAIGMFHAAFWSCIAALCATVCSVARAFGEFYHWGAFLSISAAFFMLSMPALLVRWAVHLGGSILQVYGAALANLWVSCDIAAYCTFGLFSFRFLRHAGVSRPPVYLCAFLPLVLLALGVEASARRAWMASFGRWITDAVMRLVS